MSQLPLKQDAALIELTFLGLDSKDESDRWLQSARSPFRRLRFKSQPVDIHQFTFQVNSKVEAIAFSGLVKIMGTSSRQ
jgi:hypothetical protein